MQCRVPVVRSLFFRALQTAYTRPHSRCLTTKTYRYLWQTYTLKEYQRAAAAEAPIESTKDGLVPRRPPPKLKLPSPTLEHVGIIGGGITGLATAYFARRLWPKLKVTIIEAKEECGGWIKSYAEQVTNSQGETGKVIFEAGPRTLRANKQARLTITLLRDLGLLGDVIATPKSSPAAQNRYIYYPDRLVRLPSPSDGPSGLLISCLGEPLVRKLVKEILLEVTKTRPTHTPADESIHSFLSRRLGKDITESLVSAVFHGIYAGDIKNLSAAQLLKTIYRYETNHGSILLGLLRHMFRLEDKCMDSTKFAEQTKIDLFAEEFENLHSRMLKRTIREDWGLEDDQDPIFEEIDVEAEPSVKSFFEDMGKLRRGLSKGGSKLRKELSLINAGDEKILAELAAQEAAEKAFNSEEEALKKVKKASVYTFKKGMQQLPDALREALSEDSEVTFRTGLYSKEIYGGPKVKLLCEKSGGASSASLPDNPEFEFDTVVDTTSCRVQQISGPHYKFVPGERPAETVLVVNLFYENPKLLPVRGFGYLLPSAVPAEQNPENALGVVFDSESSEGQDGLPGTKVTVMIGGHWWHSIKDQLSKDKESIEREGVEMARSVLERHLGVVDEPIHSRATLNENCIVQYRPFHRKRMRAYHDEIHGNLYGRYRVAGMPYTGVGVNDCINSGFVSAYFLYHDATGLEQFYED